MGERSRGDFLDKVCTGVLYERRIEVTEKLVPRMELYERLLRRIEVTEKLLPRMELYERLLRKIEVIEP